MKPLSTDMVTMVGGPGTGYTAFSSQRRYKLRAFGVTMEV